MEEFRANRDLKFENLLGEGEFKILAGALAEVAYIKFNPAAASQDNINTVLDRFGLKLTNLLQGYVFLVDKYGDKNRHYWFRESLKLPVAQKYAFYPKGPATSNDPVTKEQEMLIKLTELINLEMRQYVMGNKESAESIAILLTAHKQLKEEVN